MVRCRFLPRPSPASPSVAPPAPFCSSFPLPASAAATDSAAAAADPEDAPPSPPPFVLPPPPPPPRRRGSPQASNSSSASSPDSNTVGAARHASSVGWVGVGKIGAWSAKGQVRSQTHPVLLTRYSPPRTTKTVHKSNHHHHHHHHHHHAAPCARRALARTCSRSAAASAFFFFEISLCRRNGWVEAGSARQEQHAEHERSPRLFQPHPRHRASHQSKLTRRWR